MSGDIYRYEVSSEEYGEYIRTLLTADRSFRISKTVFSGLLPVVCIALACIVVRENMLRLLMLGMAAIWLIGASSLFEWVIGRVVREKTPGNGRSIAIRIDDGKMAVEADGSWQPIDIATFFTTETMVVIQDARRKVLLVPGRIFQSTAAFTRFLEALGCRRELTADEASYSA